MPEILDRDLSRPDGVRLLLSFALRAMMMLATGKKENSEEKRDAATHSLFFERISAETGTREKGRQRPQARNFERSPACQATGVATRGVLPRLRGRREQSCW